MRKFNIVLEVGATTGIALQFRAYDMEDALDQLLGWMTQKPKINTTAVVIRITEVIST